MRTLKEECLNLIWINDVTDIQPILDDFKQESNFRPNMTFGYMSPYEKRTEYLRKKIKSEKNLLKVNQDRALHHYCFKNHLYHDHL